MIHIVSYAGMSSITIYFVDSTSGSCWFSFTITCKKVKGKWEVVEIPTIIKRPYTTTMKNVIMMEVVENVSTDTNLSYIDEHRDNSVITVSPDGKIMCLYECKEPVSFKLVNQVVPPSQYVAGNHAVHSYTTTKALFDLWLKYIPLDESEKIISTFIS